MPTLSFNQFVIVDRSGELCKYLVDGTTFSPHGSVTSPDGKDASVDLQSEPVQRLAEISSICNDARVFYSAVSHLLTLTLFRPP
jgi:Ca2+ transporting ATPase